MMWHELAPSFGILGLASAKNLPALKGFSFSAAKLSRVGLGIFDRASS